MSQSANPTAPQQVAPLLALATELLRAGRPGDAIAPLRDAALLQPSNAIIQHDIGLACLEVVRVPDAIAAFQRGVAVDPYYADAYFRLGIALEKQGDIGLSRRFNLTERHTIALQAQVFNLMNHANYYVENGTGVNSIQYAVAGFGNNPDGSTTCGDGTTPTQTCYLVPNPNFGKLQVINALNGPRVMQFALKWTF